MELEDIHIAFKIRIDGIQFRNEIDFHDTTPTFKNTRLKAVHGKNELYEILIHKQVRSAHPDDLKAVIKEATQEAQHFVYVFSKVADLKIFDFQIIGYYKGEAFIDISELIPRIKPSTSKLTLHVNEKKVEKFKEKMKKDYDLPSLQQYYDACTITEPIARFISLYTILLHKVGDNQKNVDQALLKVDPTIIETKHPKKKCFETIFTRLRNELSHKREAVHLIDTHTEVKEQIRRFESLVKQIVLDDV